MCLGNVPHVLGGDGPSWDDRKSHKCSDQAQTRHPSIGTTYNALKRLLCSPWLGAVGDCAVVGLLEGKDTVEVVAEKLFTESDSSFITNDHLRLFKHQSSMSRDC